MDTRRAGGVFKLNEWSGLALCVRLDVSLKYTSVTVCRRCGSHPATVMDRASADTNLMLEGGSHKVHLSFTE